MALRSFQAIDPAKVFTSTWRKTLSFTSANGFWHDDSMLSGYPVANYYAGEPLAATLMNGSKGIRHWTSGDHSEHLLSMLNLSDSGALEAPAQYMLCDYLMFYPFIDGDSTDLQDLDNTVTLPRFEDGLGVKMFAVALGSAGNAGVMTVTYTNSDGTSGRTVQFSHGAPSQTRLLTAAESGPVSGVPRKGPFIGFASGDYGVRSVQSVQFSLAPGAVHALVLAKPIATFTQLEIGTPAETIYAPRMPEIHPDAYLGLLRLPSLAPVAARVFSGQITTVRS
jgi:hypothetical protein